MAILLYQPESDLVSVDSGRSSASRDFASAISEIDSVKLVSTHRRHDLELLSLIHDACTKLPLDPDRLSHFPNNLRIVVGLPVMEGFVRLAGDKARYFRHDGGFIDSYIPTGLTVLGESSEWFAAYYTAGDSADAAFDKVCRLHPDCLGGSESF